jgi:tRNA (mo5U34)-methyltransferase
MDSELSREEILKKLGELGKQEKWFHSIYLGDGLYTTEVVYPHLQQLWDDFYLKFGNLSGKSVLDIGCNAGFFSVAAKKHGAEKVVGIDMSEGFLDQARFVADVLNLDIEYRKLSVYDLDSLGRRFDLIFCLGVIYHCSNPFLAISNVYKLCNVGAVFESELCSLGGHDDRPLWEFVFPGFSNDTIHDRHFNWWFPNRLGLENMLRASGFGTVEKIHARDSRIAYYCTK